jgi:hypothetical protein
VLATPALAASAAGNIARVLLGGTIGLCAAYAALRMLKIDEMAYVDGMLGRAFARIAPWRRK